MIGKNVLRRHLVLALMVGLILVVFQTTLVGAGTRESLHITVTCTGFFTNEGGIILDRDNTGEGRETVYITATDGRSATLFTSGNMTFLVDGTLYFPLGTTYAFRTAPLSNPITVSVMSAAGNGLESQLIYAANGYCSGLPTIGDGGGILGVATSPSVPLNGVKPEGINPENVGQLYPGHLIVNVSWLNVRSGDGMEYTVVGRVAGNTELIVRGVNAARTWWDVEAGDILGWVSNEGIINRGDLRGAPIVEAAGEIAPVRFYVYVETTLWGLPGMSGGPVCVIPGNLEYVLVGQSASGQSIKIEAMCGDQLVTGWLPAEAGAIRNSGDLDIPVMSQ